MESSACQARRLESTNGPIHERSFILRREEATRLTVERLADRKQGGEPDCLKRR